MTVLFAIGFGIYFVTYKMFFQSIKSWSEWWPKANEVVNISFAS